MAFNPGPDNGANNGIANSADVNLDNPQKNQILAYDNTADKWTNMSVSQSVDARTSYPVLSNTNRTWPTFQSVYPSTVLPLPLDSEVKWYSRPGQDSIGLPSQFESVNLTPRIIGGIHTRINLTDESGSGLAVPSAPRSVAATAGDGSATVTWTAPETDGGGAIDGYRITRIGGQQQTVAAGVTSANITGLTNGTSYTFTVAARNSQGYGPESAPSNAVTPQPVQVNPIVRSSSQVHSYNRTSISVPKPTGTQTGDMLVTFLTTNSSTSANMAPPSGWTTLGDTIQSGNSMRVYYKVAGPSEPAAWTFATAASADYVFMVAAVGNIDSASAPRLQIGRSTSHQAPSVTPLTDSDMLLSAVGVLAGGGLTGGWTPPTGMTELRDMIGADGYAAQTVASQLLTSNSATGTRNFTPSLSQNLTAQVASVIIKSTKQATATTPAAPTGVAATASNAAATVTWTAPSSTGGAPITGYRITRTPSGQTTTVGNVTSANITGLTNGTSYTFTVAAQNSAGFGPNSTASNAVTPTAVVTPAVETYAAPSGSPVSNVYTVRANGSQTCCYGTREGHFANFAMTPGEVTLTVTSTTAINSVTIHPKRFNITPTFTPGSNTLSFKINQSHNYIVTINNNWSRPLYVFANPYDPNPPSPADVTYYYGPGFYNHTQPNGTALRNPLMLSANQSVYIHGGAYVKGQIWMGTDQANRGPTHRNIHISGYGVVDSMDVSYGWGAGRPAQIGQVNGGSIIGPTFIGRTHWGMLSFESADMEFRNTKLLNFKVGTWDTPDGMDIIGCKRMTYKNCFIRAHDDAMAFKTYKEGYGPSPYWRGNVEDILVEDMVIHQGNGGNGIEVGYENFNNTDAGAPVSDPSTGAPISHIRGVTYRRVDIVRKERDPNIYYRMAGIGIHLVDDVPLSNVLYEDVNVEYCEGEFWLWFGAFSPPDYPEGSGRAQINNVTLRRVTFDGPSSLPIHLQGGGGGKTISNLTLDNVYVKGSKLTSTSAISGKVTWNVSNTTPINFL